MEEASKSKSDDISVCMICREEEPDFLTFCNHNFHEDCLKQWHKKIENECPYCRSFTIFNEKFNLFLKNTKNNHESVDTDFDEDDFKDIFLYINKSKVSEKIFQYLVPTIKSESDKCRFLQLASEKGYFVAVQLLLNHGVQVDNSDSHGKTALIIASKNGNLEISKLLLKYGAKVEVKDSNGMTALMFASENGGT